MKVSTSVTINSTKEKVWQIISDIENSVNNIEGIMKIEVINPPGDNLIGLKWKETRMMYGKEADETMWVTHGKENVFYQTRAESHGAIYKSRFDIEEKGDACVLTMGFEGESVSLFAKIFNALFAGIMRKSMVKELDKDLQDIKKAVEALG